MIAPGARLGVLGGGQLGAFFAMAARRLGYRVAVWDPDRDAPAHRLAERSFTAGFQDRAAAEAFHESVTAVTYEWENIPAALVQTLEQSHRVTPGSRILRLLQDRLDQKTWLASQGLPVAPFQPLTDPAALEQVSRAIGVPSLCKTARAGYDGKGQWRLTTLEDVPRLQRQLSASSGVPERWVVEEFLRFEKELAVLVVRDEAGRCRRYPTVENRHGSGILRTTGVPPGIAPAVAAAAQELAAAAIEALEGVGVFCVELFLMPDGRLLINEIAPRPHNSGHYTLDACTISQFEQQVRVLCGLPLGEVRLLSAAVMVNLLGDDLTWISSGEEFRALLESPGTKLHVYHKRVARPGRKMGHVTFLADKISEAWDAARAFERRLSKATASDEAPRAR